MVWVKFILNLGVRGNGNGLVIRIRGRWSVVTESFQKYTTTGSSMGWWDGVGAVDVSSGKARASGMVRVNEVCVEKS